MKQILIKIQFALVGIFLSYSLSAQMVSTTDQVFTGTDFGTTILVPINTSNITATYGNIIIATFKVEYDPDILTYTGYTNLNPSFPGLNVSVNHNAGLGTVQFNMEDQAFSGYAFPDGKAFDIQLTYNGGFSDLSITTAEFLNDLFETDNSPVTDGSVTGFADITGYTGSWHTAGTWTGNLGSLTEPGPGHNVTIAGGGVVTLSATGTCNNLTIAAGGMLTVTGTLNHSGNVLIESNALYTGSLLHNSDGLQATIERYIPGGGYHFVSIPTTQASNPVSGLFMGSYLYRFDAPSQAWTGLGSGTNTPLNVDQGYMIWYVGGNTTYEFTGALNNGSFTAATPSVAAGDFSLVPNPYPSAINWDAASGWSGDFTPSIWVYSNGNYVTWNKDLNVGSGSQFVAVGQSFFVEANAASVSLSMTNDVRIHSSQAFLKNTKADISNLLNIKVQANDYEDNALVYFNENGSSVYNNQFDTYKLDGMSNAPQLYTVKSDDVHVTLNTLPFNINETTIVPLNFSLNSDQEITLDFSGMESFEVSYGIELEDLLTGQIVNLREQASYTFTHSVNDDASRFVLRFYGVTGIDSKSALNCKVWNNNELIYISIPALVGENARIELYDLLGCKLSEVSCTINNPIQLTAPRSGIVMVKVIAGNKVQTSKLLIP